MISYSDEENDNYTNDNNIYKSDKSDEIYLMNPCSHKNLRNITGFTNLNGENYMKYICIVLNNKLNSQQKINILDCKTENQALKKINSFGINYTHSHEFE
jgi:hypothetical protein